MNNQRDTDTVTDKSPAAENAEPETPITEAAVAVVLRSADGRFVRGSQRPPRRRPGGQAGNLSASKRPWEAYWRRRALKPADRWILPLVRQYPAGLAKDKADDMSFGQQRLAEVAMAARVCWMLAMTAGDLQASARFLNIERASLVGLGLKAAPSEVDDFYADGGDRD